MPIFGRRPPDELIKTGNNAGPSGASNDVPSSVAQTARPGLAALPNAGAVTAAAIAAAPGASVARSEIVELRALCITKMDATAVATLHPDRLLIEVERLVSDLATERRVQLNGREQRQLATELVDDMLGLGPLEPLLLDETINDIMVNGPNHVFVERSGKLIQVPVAFRDWQHLTNICQRIAASVGRRVDEASPMVAVIDSM